MKASQITDCYNILSKMESKKLPVSVSLILLQNKKKLDTAANDIGDKERQLMDLYAEKDENGEVKFNDQNQFRISKEHAQAYTDAINELMNTELEIEFDKVQLDALNRCDDPQFDSLTMEELRIIQDFMM